MVLWCLLSSALAGIGVVVDGSADTDRLGPALVEEIASLDEGLEPADVTVRYADWDADRASTLLAELVADRAIDVVVAVGPLAAGRALDAGASSKPVVAALALEEGPAPAGVTLMRLSTDLSDAAEQLSHIIGSSRVGVALPPHLAARAPLPLVVSADPDAPPPDLKGLLVTPLDALTPDAQRRLYDRWAEAGIAAVAMAADGIPPGAMGAFQGQGPRAAARRIALSVVDLHRGRTPRPADITLRGGDLLLSVPVMQALGVSPPFDVLADARLVGWEEGAVRLGLFDAVAEALANSPDLATTRARLEGDDSALPTSRASWLPSAEASATASQLDPNLASPFQSTTTVQGEVTVSQLLFSDQAVVNLGIQRDLDRSRDGELVQAEQDLAYQVASAFVGLLRSRALIEVRATDMERARRSLDVALDRQRAGDASTSEVSRWEAEVANARAALVAAWTDFRNAMVQNNLVRGAPADTFFLPDGDGLLGSGVSERLSSPAQLESVSVALTRFGVERSPELAQLEAATSAQRRALRLAKRAYVMPTVAAQAGVTWNVFQSEREAVEIPGMGELDLAAVPDAYWSVGASASLPLFEGGRRRATQREADFDVASLDHQRRQVELAVATRVRIAVNDAHGAAWRARLRAEAAEAAVRSLQAALDAYAAGTANQTTVTEARTTALQLQLSATDAAYETSQGVLDVMRAAAALPTPRDPSAPERLRQHLDAAVETP